MAKRGTKKQVDQRQMILDLFEEFIGDHLSLQGGSQTSLSDFEFRFRQLLKTVLDDVAKRPQDKLDRIEVAARMSRLLGREITKNQIDQWTAMSAIQKRMQVDALKAFCEVTGDWRTLKFFGESCGFRVLTPHEATCAEYGAQMMLKRLIDSDIKETLNGMDEHALRQIMIQRMGGGQ